MGRLLRVWRWLNHASTLAWLWSLAGSAVTTPLAIFAALAASMPWWAVLFVGAAAALFTLAFGVTWGPRLIVRARGAPAILASIQDSAQPTVFNAQAVRVTIAEVRLSGLVTAAAADEAIEIVFNIDNYSGLPVRITSVSGFIAIFGERKRPNPTLMPLPIDLPAVGARPATLTQETPGLREVIFAKGFYGGGVMPFNLGNLELRCEATMPDGSVQEGMCALPESHFLVRGPLHADEDYAAMQRVSLTFGSARAYSADGRKDDEPAWAAPVAPMPMENVFDFLRITRYQWRHNHLDDTSPYIEVCIWLMYSGLLPVEIGREVKGRAGYKGSDFNSVPEAHPYLRLGGGLEAIGGAPLRLERGDDGQVLVRHRLQDSEAAALRAALVPGGEVELTTAGLGVSVDTVSPTDGVTRVGFVEPGGWCSNLDPHNRVGGF